MTQGQSFKERLNRRNGRGARSTFLGLPNVTLPAPQGGAALAARLNDDLQDLPAIAGPLGKAQNGCSGGSELYAKKLKTFQTSLGFFDLAIAAPSMKAALEAWGADSDLFHQGAAKESDDSGAVAATMAKPDVILKRPVGSDGPSRSTPTFPDCRQRDSHRGAKSPAKPKAKPKKQAARKADTAARQAVLRYEESREAARTEQRNEESAKARERQRREQAIAKAQAAFDEAKREHDARAEAIEAERAALEIQAQSEDCPLGEAGETAGRCTSGS